jgi:hypothetical protein
MTAIKSLVFVVLSVVGLMAWLSTASPGTEKAQANAESCCALPCALCTDGCGGCPACAVDCDSCCGGASHVKKGCATPAVSDCPTDCDGCILGCEACPACASDCEACCGVK